MKHYLDITNLHWIRVADKLPDGLYPILMAVKNNHYNNRYVTKGYCTGTCFYNAEGKIDGVEEVRYWAPMPRYPDELDEEE